MKLAAMAGFALTAVAWAQSNPLPQAPPGRDSYRNAYRAWREADANLERDAATLGRALATRADSVAANAASYGEARREFLVKWAEQVALLASSLEEARAVDSVEASKAVSNAYPEVAGAQTVVVTRMMGVFAGDADPGIRQVGLALERERAALGALTEAIGQRQKSASGAQAAAKALEAARHKAAEPYRRIAAELQESASATERQSAAWAAYYKKLVAAATGPVGAGSAVTSSANPPANPSAAPSSGGVKPAERDPNLTTAAPAVVRPRGITPVPLSRYVGAWEFLPGGMFLGAQPETVDLTVSEQDGQCSGTLFARFKLPAGSSGSAVVRFDFSGALQNTRMQALALRTSDGAVGSIELIPGPAVNLLEINFKIEAKSETAGPNAATPRRVRQANVVLVKK